MKNLAFSVKVKRDENDFRGVREISEGKTRNIKFLFLVRGGKDVFV